MEITDRVKACIIKLFSVLTLLFFVWITDVSAQGFISNDIKELREINEIQVSPSGSEVLYGISHSDRPGSSYTRYWIGNLESGEQRPLLQDQDISISNPRWSPNEEWIAFYGSSEGKSGIMVVNKNGQEVRFLTESQWTNHPLPGIGERLTWSPDSKWIGYLSTTSGPETEEAEGDPVVIRRYSYKTTGSGGDYFTDNRRVQIYKVNLNSGESAQLTDNSFYDHSIDWSPKGDLILFISNREPDHDRNHNYDLYTVNVNDGSESRLTHLETMVYRAKWSPDGEMIAYQGTTRGLTSSETTMEDTHIWTVRSDGSDRQHLGKKLDNRQGSPQWSNDGKYIYFTVQERGNIALYRVSTENQQIEAVIQKIGQVRNWSIGNDGSILYGFNSIKDVTQLFHYRDDGVNRQITDLNRSLLEEREVAEIETFTFKSSDNLEIEAFLVKPIGLNPDKKRGYPLIVSIKGGPHSQRGANFRINPQIYAGQGYAVLKVNYRGSTGYGQEFTDAIFQDQNGGEARDVLYGMRAALSRYGWLDPERVGVEGGSYGGQLSKWLVTQTNEFAAAIPRAGISNLVSFNYLGYYHDYLAVEYGGFPHESFPGQMHIMDELWHRSPLRYVAQVNTPVMLVHGMNDYNVVREEAEQFYIALHDVGLKPIMVLYPRSGHGISETNHRIDLVERSIRWYEKYFENQK